MLRQLLVRAYAYRSLAEAGSFDWSKLSVPRRGMSDTPKWPPDPFPKPPPLSEYEHLSNIERKDQGYPCVWDELPLIAHEAKARKLLHALNKTPMEQTTLRASILKELLNPESNPKIHLESPFYVDYGYNITFGENCYVNYDCIFLDTAPIKIGFNCLFAPRVSIFTATHPLDPKLRQEYGLARPITIGNNTWIGGASVILPGVTIGEAVVVAAGSVVTKDVPSFCVVGGNPAHIIKYFPGATKPGTAK